MTPVAQADIGITQHFIDIERLQRQLTRAYFMADHDRLVITFSAGVGDGEGSPCEHDIAAEIFGDDLEYGYGYGSDELVLILKSCSELIASINGVRPDVNGRLNLRGAGAVRVTPDTTAHRIILDLTMPNIGCEDA